MKVLYQADNFRSAQSARLDGVPDLDVLAFAADEGRILVSHDFQTMPKYFRQFTLCRHSPGVLLVRKLGHNCNP